MMAAVGCAAAIAASSCSPSVVDGRGSSTTKPRLIVLLTVDQLRGDLLERHSQDFDGGFKRLLETGFVYRNAVVDHALTLSMAGHASIATGNHPSRHGYTGNESWGESARDGWWYQSFTADPDYSIIGAPGEDGYSPTKLMSSSLTDWVLASDDEAKSVVLAVGSHVSVPYGGKTGHSVFNFDVESGQFSTSTYYRKSLPDWVESFNRETLPDWIERSREWKSVFGAPEAAPTDDETTPGAVEEPSARFPHEFSGARDASDQSALYSWFKDTPFADLAMSELAKAPIAEERLGLDDSVDLLVLAFNGVDNIGHLYGPHSAEQYENLRLLDTAIAALLDYLDKTIGPDAYVVALTADHGVMNVPERESKQSRVGVRVSKAEIEALLDAVERAAVDGDDSLDSRIARMEAVLEGAPFVGQAWTQSELSKASAEDQFATLYKKSRYEGRYDPFPLWTSSRRAYHPARYGISVQFKENHVFYAAPAVHGSPYFNDRHVPIIFYGAGNWAGSALKPARTIDVAPTLADIAGLKLVDSADGVSLRADFER